MTCKGSHVLFICNDVAADDEDAFNEWYVAEHLPERVVMPGFLRGRRYRAIADGPGYCAFYEVASADALASPEYLAAMRDPDPRSRYFIPRFRNPARTVARVVASVGAGEGGVLGVVACNGPADIPAAAASRTLRAVLAENRGVVGVHLWQADDAALARSRQVHLRTGDTVFPWVIAVETIDEPAWTAVRHGPVPVADALGLSPLLVAGYRLLYSLTSEDGSVRPGSPGAGATRRTGP